MKNLTKRIVLSGMALGLLLPMISLAYFDSSLKYGSRGDAVIELQDFLQDQGFYNGKVDGRFGLGTRRSVIAFQAANGLKGDGYFGIASRAKANDLLTTELQPSIDAQTQEEITNPPVVAPAPTPAPTYNPLAVGPIFALPPSSTQTMTTPLPQNFSLAGTLALDFQYPAFNPSNPVVVGSFDVKNDSATTINITKLIISLSDASGNKLTYQTTPALTSLASISTSEPSGAGLNPVLPMTVNNFGVDFMLYPGETKRIDVRMTVNVDARVNVELLAVGTGN